MEIAGRDSAGRDSAKPSQSQTQDKTESRTESQKAKPRGIPKKSENTWQMADEMGDLFTSKPFPKAVPVPDSQPSADPEDDLPDEWQDFMLQLAEYEFQSLKAIAEEGNPLRSLNKIAEDNFTTIAELVDTLNQHASNTIGERVIKLQSGSMPPTIYRENFAIIKKLIETYEDLAG
jgi:hypothetical protein